MFENNDTEYEIMSSRSSAAYPTPIDYDNCHFVCHKRYMYHDMGNLSQGRWLTKSCSIVFWLRFDFLCL